MVVDYDLGNETDADASYDLEINATGRADLTSIDTEASGFHQEAHVPLSFETHAEEVALYGQEPGSYLVGGTSEQNIVFHIMNRAGRLERKASYKMGRDWL